MNNKGIAIRTILLLLIGVLVVGLLVYYVYSIFSSSSITREECRSRAISWCTGCWNAMNAQPGTCPSDWTSAGCTNNGPSPSDDLNNCADDYYGGIDESDNCYNDREFCRNFIPMD